MLSPTCALPTAAAPECAKRLVLRECLERQQREAQLGVCDTARYRCRYVVWGRGPTIVLVPGMGMDAQGFVMLMARLQTHFRCVSYDLPDGDTDGAHVTRYRHADLVADLFALLDHLSVNRCTVLGSSFGSTIALAAAHAQSSRFSQVILQGGFARRRLAPLEVLAASFARFRPGRLGILPLVRQVLRFNVFDEFKEREPDVWEFFVQQNLQIPVRALATRVLMIHDLDLRPILPTITQPTLLVCGDCDRLVGKSCERELQQGLRNAARAEIEQCGHMPQLTHPEVLAEAVQLYLSRAAS